MSGSSAPAPDDWDAALTATLTMIAVEVGDGGDRQPGDVTAVDLARALRCSVTNAREKLNRLVSVGKMVKIQHVRDPRLESGQRVTVYRPVS